jgi:arylsulfatase A-like enzyme/Flp pilus assembly protein TadD
MQLPWPAGTLAVRAAPLLIGAVLTLCCTGPDDSSEGPTAGDGPPPIIILSIDTLRADRLPLYGYPQIATPAIDRLGREGIVFDRAYAQVPLTMPSHASLLTGLLPPAHGVRDNLGYRLETAGLPYLPTLLRQAGYATGAAVSAYALRGAAGFAEGFDFYEDSIERRPGAGLGGLQRPGAVTLEALLPWLRQAAAGERPLFLFFHLFEPHTPYEAPEPFRSRYPDPYDGEVAAADAAVGRLLDELDRLGLYRRAVILLLSDHGEGLGDHGEEEHGVLLYRESLQVPLVLRLPGGRDGGRRVARPVALIDVFPTLLELAGLPLPPEIAGVSLLHGSTPEAPTRPLFAETWYPRLHFGWSELTSVIDGRFHYIHGPDPELYDLEADPGETVNVVQSAGGEADRLRRLLEGYPQDLQEPLEEDEATRRALEALGYVGRVGGAHDDKGGSLPDPKSRLATVDDLKEGLRYYSAGQMERAVEAYRRAVEANPGALDAWEYLGRSLSRLGRHEEALDAQREAYRLSGSSHLLLAAAQSLLALGRVEEALQALAEGLARDPRDLSLRLLQARTLAVAGRLEEAFDRAEALVTERPDSADALYLRGALRIGLGDLAAAEADLRAALALAPGHPGALSDLVVLLEHQGRRQEAGEVRQRLQGLRSRPDR